MMFAQGETENNTVIEIVMLNSSTLQQDPKIFQGHGFIGEKQLKFAGNSMGWDDKQNNNKSFRIVALHHNLFPVTYTESLTKGKTYSVVFDAEALIRWVIKYRVNLVLHGHMHQPYHIKVKRKGLLNDDIEHEFDIVGLGSTGDKTDLGEINANTFGILDFSTGDCEILIYTIHHINPSEKKYTIKISR